MTIHYNVNAKFLTNVVIVSPLTRGIPITFWGMGVGDPAVASFELKLGNKINASMVIICHHSSYMYFLDSVR